MQFLDDKQKIFDWLAKGATVITPNNRLSERLLQDYYAFQTKQTLDKPKCLPYSTALIQAYNNFTFCKIKGTNHPLLLSTMQCRHLWKQSIVLDESMCLNNGLLEQIMQAWTQCLQWGVNPENQEFEYTNQTSLFRSWWQKVNETLSKKNLITEFHIIPYLINNKASVFSKTIIWYCFDDFHPQQRNLQNYLESQGQTQYHYSLKESNTLPRLLATQDTKAEYQQVIAWLQLQLNEGYQRIGLVVPNLQEESSSLQRALLHHISASDFNISLGQPLSAFTMVAHAWVWLSLDSKGISSHQAALLLQSPYLGQANTEFLKLSQYLQESKLLQQQTFSLFALAEDLKSHAPLRAEILSQLKAYPKEASANTWVNLFQERLRLLGFPGDNYVDSEHYQCFQKLEGSFDDFRQLQLLQKALTLQEALAAFKDILDTTIFQPQKKLAPIQISGLLEASGCEFDVLWVMGLTDSTLPQSTHISAFIPAKLQKTMQMPRSLPEKELHFAKQRLQRLKNGCAEAVFSYPILSKDTPNLPCTLITEYPHFQPIPFLSTKATALQVLEESYHIPFTEEESRSGGTAVLANQAKCPFKAFSEHRLKARVTPMLRDGLDNKLRGELLHKVMELIWKNLKTHQILVHLSQEVLESLVDTAIVAALTPITTAYPHLFTSTTQGIESQRIKKIILDCLAWEKQRLPFEVIATESSFSIILGGFTFQVRIDRIDKIEGSKWVIDYKSSLPASKSWKEDRPQEPQLLLYSLSDEAINALFFMQLKSGKLQFSGLSEADLGIPGVSFLKKEESWANRTSHWKSQLTALIEEFQEGHCPPQPSSQSICQFCDFQNLCRFQKV